MARELRIIGPPGCGKTTELARRVRQAAGRYGGENVLVCSLTKAAAAEVTGRETPIPERNIATLHSFAFRALGVNSDQVADSPKGLKAWNLHCDEEGFPFFRLSNPGISDVDDAAAENGRGGETLGDRAFDVYNNCRARLQEVGLQSEYTQQFASLWERWKSDQGWLDFTDLLDYAWRDCEAAPGNPAVLMGDETQDLSRLGLRLLRKWAGPAEWLVTVGDPLQCLYAWAGTDPEGFITPDIDSEHKRVLSQGYRVPRAVQQYALEWIRPLKTEIEAHFGKAIEYEPRRELVGTDAEEKPVFGETVEGEVRRLGSAHFRYPEPAVNLAEEFLEQGKSVMFIASCSHFLDATIQVLRKRGLPFHNPWRLKRGDWNPLARRRGTTATDRILAFLRLSPEVWGDQARLWSPHELWAWVEVLEAKGLLQRGAKSQLEAEAKGPFAGEDAVNPAVFDSAFEMEPILQALAHSEEGSLEWFRERLLPTKAPAMAFPLTVAEKRGPSALLQRPQITVGTAHSLKGSEADVVFVFPDLSQAGMAEWCGSGSGHDGIRRLFYVALTRARETLVLCSQATPMAVVLH